MPFLNLIYAQTIFHYLAEFREFGTFPAGKRATGCSSEICTARSNSGRFHSSSAQCSRSFSNRCGRRGLRFYLLSSLLLTESRLTKSGLETHMWICCVRTLLLIAEYVINLWSSVVEQYSKDWTEHTALLAIKAVLSHIASLNPDEQTRSLAIETQIHRLNIANWWSNKLQSLLCMTCICRLKNPDIFDFL